MGLIRRLWSKLFSKTNGGATREAVGAASARAAPQPSGRPARQPSGKVARRPAPAQKPASAARAKPKTARSASGVRRPASGKRAGKPATSRRPAQAARRPASPPPAPLQPAAQAAGQNAAPGTAKPVEGLSKELNDSPEHRKAMRIARGMLSDLEAYHADKMDKSIREGTFFTIFQEELAELRRSYETRIPSEIRGEFDHFNVAVKELIDKRKASGQAQ